MPLVWAGMDKGDTVDHIQICSRRDIEAVIREKLSTNPNWAKWALLCLYSNQTQQERRIGENTEINGKGFTGFDCEILSSFADFYLQRAWLSPKQLAVLYKRLPKYHQQISEALDQNEHELVLDGTFIPDPRPKVAEIDTKKIHEEVRGMLSTFFHVQIIEGWRPAWLKGSSFDYFIPDARLAVDVTGTKERPINTPAYHSDAARKNSFAGHHDFTMFFIRADKPSPAGQLRSALKAKFGDRFKPVHDDSLIDESGEFRV